MTKYSKTLLNIASKLGLVKEDKVLSKAEEFERLLQTKAITGSSMTVTSKIVICLDLAANLLGAEFDEKMALKYSGLKRPGYTNCKKVIRNLLQMKTEATTTALLCVALQCVSVQQLADQILQEFQKDSKMEIDMNLPHYACMAVYQACRVNKIKIPKGNIIEKSRLKPSQWNKMDTDWKKIVNEKFVVTKKKCGENAKTTIKVEQNTESMDMDTDYKEQILEPQVEPYENWKQRMLETAEKEMKELQKAECSSNAGNVFPLRRSPRKTPQKFSPYKTTNNNDGGVRLLFS